MRKFKFSKLVRDKIVEKIESSGSKAEVKTLNDAEYLIELKRKLIEEAKELEKASNEELPEELADIQEIVVCISKLIQLDKQEMARIQEMKNEKAGSFEKRQFIETVKLNEEDKKWLDYFLANAERYPEVKE